MARTRMASAISKDDGRTFSSIRIFDGAKDFPGKMTMADISFVGDNALVFYSKSHSKSNCYAWMEQILPIRWFYEGDDDKIYGEAYLRAFQKTHSE